MSALQPVDFGVIPFSFHTKGFKSDVRSFVLDAYDERFSIEKRVGKLACCVICVSI